MVTALRLALSLSFCLASPVKIEIEMMEGGHVDVSVSSQRENSPVLESSPFKSSQPLNRNPCPMVPSLRRRNDESDSRLPRDNEEHRVPHCHVTFKEAS